MRLEASREFTTWLRGAREKGGPLLTRAAALLAHLRELHTKPTEESATFKRVRQARRHEIWRVAHPYDPAVAVRVLCWFPEDHTAVVVLVGGDKAPIGDIWYDSATPRAEAAVDQWLREHKPEERR